MEKLMAKVVSSLFMFALAFSVNAQNLPKNTPLSASFITLPEAEQMAFLKRSLKSDPTNTTYWLLAGSLWENIYQLDSAVFAYQKALSIDRKCERCIQLLANALASQGRINAALKHYNHAMKLYPSNTTVRSHFARLLKKENRFIDAYRQFSKLIENDSTNYFLWEQLGDCAMRIDSQEMGLKAYLTSFELNQANMPLALKLINSFIQSKNFPSFIMTYADAAYKQDSTYTPIIKTKGYLFFLAESYPEAEVWLSKALLKGDSSVFTMKYLGISQFHVGKYLSSCNLLGQVYARDTTDKGLNYFYAKAMNEIGDYNKAIAVIDQTVRLLTPIPEELASLYGTKGASFQKRQEYNLAIEQFQIAYEKNPSYLTYLFDIGTCYYGSKQYQQAKETINRFIILAEEEQHKLGSTQTNLAYAKHLLKRIETELFFNDKSEN